MFISSFLVSLSQSIRKGSLSIFTVSFLFTSSHSRWLRIANIISCHNEKKPKPLSVVADMVFNNPAIPFSSGQSFFLVSSSKLQKNES
jgi:hypothetical protein